MMCCDTCIGNGSGWYAGAGIYYLQPRWGSNPAFTAFNPATTSSITQNFDFRAHVAPVVYAGYTGKRGLGFRANWFSYIDRTTGPTGTPDGVATGAVQTPTTGITNLTSTIPGNTLSTTGALGVTAIDFEITKSLNAGCGSYLVSGGVRYGNVGQQYGAAVPGTGGLLSDGHRFNGFGPTMAAQARYAIPYARGAGVYGRARGSMLIGQEHDLMQYTTATVNGSTFSSSNQVVPVGELEVGLDWFRRYRAYGFFMQGGFVVQSWFGVGNTSNSDIISTPGVHTTSAFNNGTLGLYGLRTSGGVTF
jgi:hypothetical protein